MCPWCDSHQIHAQSSGTAQTLKEFSNLEEFCQTQAEFYDCRTISKLGETQWALWGPVVENAAVVEDQEIISSSPLTHRHLLVNCSTNPPPSLHKAGQNSFLSKLCGPRIWNEVAKHKLMCNYFSCLNHFLSCVITCRVNSTTPFYFNCGNLISQPQESLL